MSSGAGPNAFQKVERSVGISVKCEVVEAVKSLRRLLSDLVVDVEYGGWDWYDRRDVGFAAPFDFFALIFIFVFVIGFRVSPPTLDSGV